MTPRNRKNCCRKLGLSSRGKKLLGKKQKSQQIFGQNCEKAIFHRDFIKKSQNFLTFANFLIFCPNAQSFARMFLTFPCLMDNIHQILLILNFLTKRFQSSAKFARVFIPFQNFQLNLRQFC